VGSCEDGFDVIRDYVPDCVDEYTAAIDCAADRPASDWACSAEGLAQLNAAFCNTELETFATCAGL
jgi:hypothetical protein